MLALGFPSNRVCLNLTSNFHGATSNACFEWFKESNHGSMRRGAPHTSIERANSPAPTACVFGQPLWLPCGAHALFGIPPIGLWSTRSRRNDADTIWRFTILEDAEVAICLCMRVHVNDARAARRSAPDDMCICTYVQMHGPRMHVLPRASMSPVSYTIPRPRSCAAPQARWRLAELCPQTAHATSR